jgi:serine/threonine-protein kinase
LEQSEKLGKYQIESILGEGGMGIVYKAYDPHLARVVAIKTIRRGLLEGKSGQDLRERFSREARAEGRLIHPNIITIYEFQEDAQGTPFFVMEYAEGKDLKQYLSRGIRFDLEKTLHIIEQVLRALSHSHGEGVVHRDIKPANIILQENDTVKIADFGIARMEESEFTQTGMVMGTPQYISPEQRLGRRVDGRTDLYSTGAVLYELLTGQKASPGLKASTLWQRLTDGGSARSDTLDANDAKIQRIFRIVVVKALAQDPDDRFASAEEFIQAIENARPTPESSSGKYHKGLWLGSILGAVVLAAVYFLSSPAGESTSAAAPAETQPTAVSQQAAIVVPVSLTAEQAQKVQQHLKVARIHLLVGRLIFPAGSNAAHSYKLALDIDPENVEARSGLQNVEKQLIEQVEQRIASGDVSGAEEQLSASLQSFPGSARLSILKQQVTLEQQIR